MGTFKGNLGNLMQHWVLCEVLEALQKWDQPDLFFLCTHSMAPWSNLEPRPSGTQHFHRFFDQARERLFDGTVRPHTLSLYESAWTELSPSDGLPYPSSAVFATKTWRGNLSLWLCETDGNTAAEISEWWNRPGFKPELLGRRIWEDEWQRCFRQQPTLLFERARECDFAMIELDPDMVIRQVGTRRANSRIVYHEDLALIHSLLRRLSMPVIVQLSSYSTMCGNTPDVIEAAVTPALQEVGLALQGQVVAENSMTSLVYARGVTLWNAAPPSLSASFNRWLPAV